LSPRSSGYSSLRKKEIYFDRALYKAYWLWRRNQALIVPTMLSSSISVLTQSIFVIFGMAFIVQVEQNGTLSQMAAAASAVNYSRLASIFFSRAVFLPFIVFIGASIFFAVVVTILANGFALSSEYVSYREALDGKKLSIGEVILSVKDKWKEMAWTNLLAALIIYGPIGLAVLGAAVSLYLSGGNVAGLIGLFGLLGIGGLAYALLAFFLMYSPVVVALENLSGFAAIRRSFSKVFENLGVSFTYAIVRVVSYLGIILVGVAGQYVGVPLTSLASIAVTLLLVPILHLTKTTVYREMLSSSEMEFEMYNEYSAGFDLFHGPYARYVLHNLRCGLGALRKFIFSPENVVYHILSLGAFLIGVFAGSYVATHGLAFAIFTLGYKSGQINPTILNTVPLSEGFDIFFHNWQVSLASALSGLWLVAPSLVTLGFNGVILGVVYYLTPNTTMFAAAIFPHGIIELPAFILAGSAGVRLGVAFLGTLSKKYDQGSLTVAEDRFRQVARETIFILLGLVVLFLIAGFIEGNITPAIMRSVGWR
jgi:uncharacterized membrane protein SpoIIM required for sporulation